MRAHSLPASGGVDDIGRKFIGAHDEQVIHYLYKSGVMR